MTESWKSHHLEKARRHRVTFKRSSATSTQIDKEGLPGHDTQKSTVFHLVYRYLNEIAERNMRWKQRNSACNRFRKEHARRKYIRKRTSMLSGTNFGARIGDMFARTNQNGLSETFKIRRSLSEESIADYAKAVSDERRRAKLYMRDALSYGLQSGLLIPTRRRNMLRVSEKLGIFSPKNSTECEEDRSSKASSNT